MFQMAGRLGEHGLFPGDVGQGAVGLRDLASIIYMSISVPVPRWLGYNCPGVNLGV